jgi:hypothetical protein
MQNSIVLRIDTLKHAGAIECAGVAGLPTARGIERGAVKGDCGPTTNALGFINDSRFEFD